MESNNFHRSDSLVKLAERLRLYNHPLNNSSNSTNAHIQNQSPGIQECKVNDVVSKEQELKSEFGTDPIDDNSRRVKSNRAAVLVCLFEDQKGHLRVILTKRASTLFTHSESAGKVVSQLGFQESVTPISAVENERFKPKRAAVLICLFERDDDGELRVILTKRSSKLSTHSGEVALPGGKAEEGDASDADTATREAKEEIGLDPSLVNIVTCLEPFLSKHLLRVIPVIGILPNKKEFNPTPNIAEVEAVFDVPLEMFLKDENRRSEEREWMGEKYLIHLFDYELDNKKYLIWGLTAGILIRAASVVYQRPPAFLEQNPKFKLPKVVDKDTTMS